MFKERNRERHGEKGTEIKRKGDRGEGEGRRGRKERTGRRRKGRKKRGERVEGGESFLSSSLFLPEYTAVVMLTVLVHHRNEATQ